MALIAACFRIPLAAIEGNKILNASYESLSGERYPTTRGPRCCILLHTLTDIKSSMTTVPVEQILLSSSTTSLTERIYSTISLGSLCSSPCTVVSGALVYSIVDLGVKLPACLPYWRFQRYGTR